MRSLSVIACDPCNGFYYPGFVTQLTEFATTTVKFYCRRQIELRTEQVIPLGGAVPWPHLQVEDFALVRVFFRTLHEEAYVPAQVWVLPETSPTCTKLYTLRLYNGVMVHKPRRFIVKIAREKFEAIVDTILEIRSRKPILFNAMESQEPRHGRQLKRRPRQAPLVLRRPVSSYQQKTTVSRELQRIYGRKTRIYQSAPMVRRRRRTLSADHILDVIGCSSTPIKHRRPPSKSTSSKSTSSSSTVTVKSNIPVPDKDIDTRTAPIPALIRNETPLDGSRRSKSAVEITSKAKKDEGTNDIEPKTRSSDTLVLQVHTDYVEEIKINDSQSSSLSSSSKSSNSINDVIHRTDDVTNAAPVEKPKDTVVVQELEDSYSDDTFEDSDVSSIMSTKKKSTRPVSISSSIVSKHGTSRTTLSKVSSTNSINRNRDRKSRKIYTGQEVLARWPDDGWYYFCSVVTEIDDERFVVRDSTGHIETVAGDDIFTESQQLFDVIQPGDHVIGLHPTFLFSYAPAVVRDVYGLGVRVEFFDWTEARLPFEEVYKLSPNKYKQDTEYIRVCAERVCKQDGGEVVARDDATGFYTPCFAECPTSRSHFIIRMLNGAFRKQAAVHVFERTPALSSYNESKDEWHYMLAPLDDTGSVYLPAAILQRFPWVVKFADGSHQTLDSLKDCFFLNDSYYKNAVDFFIEKSAKYIVSPGRVVNAW